VADRAAQGRLAERQPVAVIDMGSNSVRLVIYEGIARSPTPLYQEKVMCGLGRALNRTNRLSAEAIPRALAALRRFRLLAEQYRTRAVYPFATAAVRWAEDGEEFLARAETAGGAAIRVLSGEEEARLAALGVMAGFNDPDGIAGDLGGGSLELIDMANRAAGSFTSLPVGGLALIDASGGDRLRAGEIIDAQLGTVDWLERGRGRAFYAVGGTWRALAKLHMNRVRYPLSAVHGFKLELETALQVSSRFANTSARALRKIEGMSVGREETLPYGALLLNRLLRRMQPDCVIFSAFGVREGLLLSMMPPEELAKDPLIAACEEAARLRARSPEHAHELVAWTDPLFTVPELLETAEDRRLRMAACLLSDLAWRAHPDYRGEQSASLIAQSALVGLDHPARAFLALCVFHRYSRSLSGELLPQLDAMLRARTRKRALIIGTAVRLANNLAGGMPGVLPHAPLAYEEGRLVLSLPARFADLDGESVHRRLRVLADIVNRPAELRIANRPGGVVSSFFRGLIGRPSEEVS
jgi:exopolyphosphatase/guanosine-5'-triphosphate,3'-diphosphate pyrophosphatase